MGLYRAENERGQSESQVLLGRLALVKSKEGDRASDLAHENKVDRAVTRELWNKPFWEKFGNGSPMCEWTNKGLFQAFKRMAREAKKEDGELFEIEKKKLENFAYCEGASWIFHSGELAKRQIELESEVG